MHKFEWTKHCANTRDIQVECEFLICSKPLDILQCPQQYTLLQKSVQFELNKQQQTSVKLFL